MNWKNEIIGLPLKVLILEDSIPDFELIQEQLTSAGYTLDVTHVVNEKEFTFSLNKNRFDIILSDFNLPGFDAFGALLIRNKNCPDVPFICISGSIGEETAIELLKLGAVDYVLKDRPNRLPFAVKRAIGEQNEKRALQLAEEELRKNETKFRTLTENIPDIIARFDKDLRHIYINPAIEKITGMPKESFIGKTNEELGMPEEKVAIWNENMRYVFETGKQRIFEFDFQTKEDTSYFLSMLVPELAEDGEIDTLLCVTRDISERKRFEIELRKSEERLRDIIFSSADWVWEVDKNGRYIYSSQKVNELFEASEDAIIGKTPFDFMPEEEAKRIAPIFTEIVARKEPIKDLENWNFGKNGQLICLLTNGLPVFNDEGELIGYRGIDKNITERKLSERELIKAKEKAEESDRLKSAFLANMSHEIRTPMNGILGFISLLEENQIAYEERMSFFDIIKQSSERLLHTINDIIKVSQIDANLEKVSNENFKISSLMDYYNDFFSQVAKEKGLELIVSCDLDQENDSLYTDKNKLDSILTNLLNNAIKFTDKGKVSCKCFNEDHQIKFVVEDTGCGIPQNYINDIFNRFVQGDTSLTRGYEGSGLGLSISKSYVEMLGGTIGVNSEVGKGTAFFFTIPFRPFNNNSSVYGENINEGNVEFIKNLNILIVEDDTVSRSYLENILNNNCRELFFATNGMEAIDIIKSNPLIDLILMDIKIPVMDGYEATQKIRKFNKDVIIVAQSANAFNKDREMAIEAGCNSYISKPIKKEMLLETIRAEFYK